MAQPDLILEACPWPCQSTGKRGGWACVKVSLVMGMAVSSDSKTRIGGIYYASCMQTWTRETIQTYPEYLWKIINCRYKKTVNLHQDWVLNFNPRVN